MTLGRRPITDHPGAPTPIPGLNPLDVAISEAILAIDSQLTRLDQVSLGIRQHKGQSLDESFYIALSVLFYYRHQGYVAKFHYSKGGKYYLIDSFTELPEYAKNFGVMVRRPNREPSRSRRR